MVDGSAFHGKDTTFDHLKLPSETEDWAGPCVENCSTNNQVSNNHDRRSVGSSSASAATNQGPGAAGEPGDAFGNRAALLRLILEEALKRAANRLPYVFGLGEAVAGSIDSNLNCMALACSEGAWVQAGQSGFYGPIVIGRATVSRDYYWFHEIPKFFGGKVLSDGMSQPAGTILVKVYYNEVVKEFFGQEFNSITNVHIVRQQSPGSILWESKNGGWYRFKNILNPDDFFNHWYPSNGRSVKVVTYYLPISQ